MSTRKPPVRKDGAVGRFYHVDGRDLPSVTHILSVIAKPALIAWSANQERDAVCAAAADLYAQLHQHPLVPRAIYLTTLQAALGKEKAHQRELAKAGEIGTQIHARIEYDLRQHLGLPVGVEPVISEAAEYGYLAFLDWARSVRLKPLRIETVVFSLEHGYAGTMDLLAEVDGALTLIDWKSGKSVYAEAHLQNAAYRFALAEMGIADVERGLIVRLPKVESDPNVEVVESPATADLMPAFLAARALWSWWHDQERAYQERRKAAKESAA